MLYTQERQRKIWRQDILQLLSQLSTSSQWNEIHCRDAWVSKDILTVKCLSAQHQVVRRQADRLSWHCTWAGKLYPSAKHMGIFTQAELLQFYLDLRQFMCIQHDILNPTTTLPLKIFVCVSYWIATYYIPSLGQRIIHSLCTRIKKVLSHSWRDKTNSKTKSQNQEALLSVVNRNFKAC